MNWDSSDLFFLDCGSLECERWLKEVTGEDLVDKNNLAYSLLQGQQLRKVVNLLRKNTFHFDESDTTGNIFSRTRIYCDNFINDRDWVSQFIVIAEKSLGIFPQYIFHWKDLHNSCEAQFIAQKESIFRICVTVIKLFDLYRKRFPDLPKSKLFDLEIRQELLALHKRQINTCEEVFWRPKTHLMLTRYLEDVKKAAKSATENSPSVSSTDDSNLKSVITTRDVRYYPEVTVPQPFVQPTNQFSIRMATQAVEQTIISKKQNEHLRKIKETIKPENDDCHDHVNNWRNKRRARSISKTETNKIYEKSDGHFESPFLHVYPVFESQKRKDTQEQIIIASPNQRNEGSQDSGLENSTPEVSPPGAQTRAYWRTDSASPVSSADDSLANSRAKGENMTQRFASSKRSLAPSPPTEETVQSLSSLSLHSTPQFEQNTNANFLCRKDHSEAALCKAVVAQGALEEAFGTFKAVPSHKNGKFSSVRIEIEATRENHAKVAAVKTISTKETLRASGHFKPMCEMIDESLQKRQRNSYSAESSISPASSSRSSDFGGDNGSLDRMSFGSSNAGSGGDYKVVALDAKPQPGKLSEFVPEVERSKRDESYVVSSYGNMNNLPSTDTAVVRNWELSDEELLQSKSLTNNNEKSSNVGSPNEEIKHEPAYVDRKFIRSQGYPTPFDARSKNYVNADSKFRILPKDENRSRPIVTKVQQNEASFHEESRQVHNNVRTPSGTPQKRQSINVMNERKPMEKVEKPQTMLTVSGKLRCGHCACELGRGSAMIIEALGLFYHINCFRCHVCDRALGSGSQTTDVRVRDGKLHCEKCYSNEEIGVQLSEI